MSISELLRTAIHSLRINPLRTALSVLGVIFGIAAVIVLVSIGNGVRVQITDQIKGLGTDLIVVKSGQEATAQEISPAESILAGQLNTSSLTQSDVERIAEIDGIVAASGKIEQLDSSQAGDRAMNGLITGGDENLLEVRKLDFDEAARGWSFEEQEPGTAAIGQLVVDLLFDGNRDVIGESIKIGGREFTVKAVIAQREKSLFADPNKETYISIEDAREIFGAPGTDKVREVNATMEDPGESARIKKDIEAVLGPVHRRSFEEANPGKKYEDDFYVATQDDLMKSYDKIMGILNALVIGVALVALAESGIGVSNIMYISVKERTREIGVRLAQGASKKAILAQFLFESVTLCVMGAAIGIPMGWLVSFLINSFTVLPAQTPLWGVMVAFGAAAVVGIAAGVYPAWKATQADIAVALRSE